MIESIIKNQYGMELLASKKLSVGAGSNTYIVETSSGKYILKNPSTNAINHPELEPMLCEYLLKSNISVSEYVKNLNGEYITKNNNEIYNMQKFVEGINYDLNTAPDWLMIESAQLLGKIHTALNTYPQLPCGIGEGFFKHMTSITALKSYEKTIEAANARGDIDIAKDLSYRIDLLTRKKLPLIDVNTLTCSNTHGDYFISQLICGENKINAVIDWTSACVHPVVWEIIRSFVYGDKSCIDGEINIDKLISYVNEYKKYAKLTKNDISQMANLFFYQISVCDYYNQYYQSTADNRNIYLHQAIFSTRLMKWFDLHIDELNKKLCNEFN